MSVPLTAINNQPINNQPPTNTLKPPEPKIVIPDQLNITIRTSIPGHQSIDYKPSMTIKGIDEKGVRFNPLMKLDKARIDTIPDQYRIKQFYNSGLFKSLMNYINGTLAKDLTQATRYGYVNNNIKVTIDTIFPVNSVIYIGDKPYVIADTQWSTGDWSINVKQKKTEIDPNKITDPRLYTELMKEEMATAEEQLSQIPTAILVGDNYNGPPPVKPVAIENKPVAIENKPVAIENKPVAPVKPTLVKPLAIEDKPKPLAIEDKPTNAAIEDKHKPLLIEDKQKNAAIENKPTNAAIENKLEPLAIENQSPVEEVSPEEEQLFENFGKDFKINGNATKFFTNYFSADTYYNMIKSVYEKFNENLKTNVRQFYVKTTNYAPKGQFVGKFSKISYEQSCEQVSILKSIGDGNCFFQAVADGINIYNYENYENKSSKIISGLYGKKQLFTIKFLRDCVFKYIMDLGEVKVNEMLKVAQSSVNPLNNAFSVAIDGQQKEQEQDITPNQYLAELNNVYFSQDNFLIYKPTEIQIDITMYNNPFRVITVQELSAYILSPNYWANDIAIEAMCKKLKICVIPIENYIVNKVIKLKPINISRLKTLLTNNDIVNTDCSTKVMFLNYTNNHYELIRFIYKTNPKIKNTGEGMRQTTVYVDKYYTIFNKNEILPPIHILFLIYGSIYSQLSDETKQNFSIYINFMKAIHTSIQQIINGLDSQSFLKGFNNYFPGNTKIKEPSTALVPESKEESTEESKEESKEESTEKPELEEQSGGLLNSNPYNSNPYNSNPSQFNSNLITKKPSESGTSKIAYNITIDMELHPGKSLTPEELKQSKCNSKSNAIKKAFAEFTGNPYVITPVYKNKEKASPIVNNNLNKTKKQDVVVGGRKTRKHKHKHKH